MSFQYFGVQSAQLGDSIVDHSSAYWIWLWHWDQSDCLALSNWLAHLFELLNKVFANICYAYYLTLRATCRDVQFISVVMHTIWVLMSFWGAAYLILKACLF